MSRDWPGFWEMLTKDQYDDVKSRGFLAIIPFTLISCTTIGFLVAYFMPEMFFKNDSWDVSATVFGGVLAFNALTLALSWNAFGRIYELLAKPRFSSFLRSSGELNRYLFYISYFHKTQIFAAIITFFALFWIFMPVESIYIDKVVLGFVVFATSYALRWSVGSAGVAHDLVLVFSEFDGLTEDQLKSLTLAVNNDVM